MLGLVKVEAFDSAAGRAGTDGGAEDDDEAEGAEGADTVLVTAGPEDNVDTGADATAPPARSQGLGGEGISGMFRMAYRWLPIQGWVAAGWKSYSTTKQRYVDFALALASLYSCENMEAHSLNFNSDGASLT